MPASLIVAVAVAAVGLLAAAVLLIRSAAGLPRVLGIIGAVLILLGVVTRFAYQWLVERFLGRVEDSTIVTILAVDTAAGGILTGAGLLLVSAAIAAAGRQPKI
ncbi:hypothetical protein [Microlunatus sp. Gsoil 973]|uniref:hypothetical protein n=1 Tax=Microlunatus sp. Gsoil 973 TaxID=2672569 RepID=UPI0012B45595|nr:hypothetical protein [Microlunatus sp. Gsoil 973]QGN33920.1 hypothetical protein GJV80_15085 [Microlunatus sp. Gsoil 973]